MDRRIAGLICCGLLVASSAYGMMLPMLTGGVTVTADTTAPTHSSSSVASNGTSWTFTCDENMAVGAGGAGGLTVTMTTAGAITLSSCSASGSNILCTGSPAVGYGDTISAGVSYTQPTNGFEDTAGNDLASFSNHASFTNNVPSGGAWHWPSSYGDSSFTTDEGGIDGTYHVGAPIVISGSGTATKMAAQVTNNSGSAITLQFCLFDASHSQVATATANVPNGTTAQWIESGAISGAVTAQTYRVLVSQSAAITWRKNNSTPIGCYNTNSYASGCVDDTCATDDGPYAVKLWVE